MDSPCPTCGLTHRVSAREPVPRPTFGWVIPPNAFGPVIHRDDYNRGWLQFAAARQGMTE